jgi:hypothetical protein
MTFQSLAGRQEKGRFAFSAAAIRLPACASPDLPCRSGNRPVAKVAVTQ